MNRAFPAFSLAVLTVVMLQAETAPRFDAVSVKPNHSGAPGSDTSTSPGRLMLLNATTMSLLLRAFGVQVPQIIGAPGWVSTERYDVIAVTGDAQTLSEKARQPFVQSMLAERWQLRFHRETRPLSVYSLRIAKGGPKLRAYSGKGEYAMKMSFADGKQVLNSTKGNIPRLVEMLSGATGKIVINDTALNGQYDFTLTWVQDIESQAAGPSLTTALQDQLGLKLEAVKRPMEVIVVDSIDRPSAN